MKTIKYLFAITGKSLLKKIGCFTLFPRSGERVIDPLDSGDDRVSANEVTLTPMHHGDYSPRLRYAGRPSLRCTERGLIKLKAIPLLAIILFVISSSRANAAPADVNSAINNVLKSYLDIKNALVTDNSKAANDAAQKFTAALKDVPVDQMGTKQKAEWAKYAEKLRFDGEHISESTAIAHQREHFGSLSGNMYAVLKAFPANDVLLYKQYCPMEKKSWLSESAAIKNPYYGKKMLTCGVTKETLKAGK